MARRRAKRLITSAVKNSVALMKAAIISSLPMAVVPMSPRCKKRSMVSPSSIIEAAAATASAGRVADRMATPATGVIISAPRPLRPLLA